jgi:hypothetical protein
VVTSNPRSGEIVVDRWIDNLITTKGRDLLAQLLTGEIQGITAVLLAIGGYTPGTPVPSPYPAAAPADERLHRPLRRLETSLLQVGTRVESNPPRALRSISALIPAEIGGDVLVLREAGLVMSTAAGDPGEADPTTGLAPGEVLYNRVVFDAITKDPQLQMTLTWEVMF